jgi:hypothetical protein
MRVLEFAIITSSWTFACLNIKGVEKSHRKRTDKLCQIWKSETLEGEHKNYGFFNKKSQSLFNYNAHININTRPIGHEYLY